MKIQKPKAFRFKLKPIYRFVIDEYNRIRVQLVELKIITKEDKN